MNPTIVAYLVTAFLYSALAVHFWRTRWIPARTASPTSGRQTWERLAALAPLVLHSALDRSTLSGTSSRSESATQRP